jgi:hypothetical protein
MPAINANSHTTITAHRHKKPYGDDKNRKLNG